MYSGITSGRVLNGELLYTKILEVNLFANKLTSRIFVYIGFIYVTHFKFQKASFNSNRAIRQNIGRDTGHYNASHCFENRQEVLNTCSVMTLFNP